MSKKITIRSSVFQYFNFSDDNKFYICNCVSEAKISAFCGSEKNAQTRAYNLKRHLERNHPKIFANVKENNQAASLSKTSTSSASASMKLTRSSSKRQRDMTKFITSDKITIAMTAEAFQKSIIGLVVQNSLSLIMFSQPPFQNLIGETARKFKFFWIDVA